MRLKASIEDIAREVDGAPLSEDKNDAETALKRLSSLKKGKSPMTDDRLDKIDEEDEDWDNFGSQDSEDQNLMHHRSDQVTISHLRRH